MENRHGLHPEVEGGHSGQNGARSCIIAAIRTPRRWTFMIEAGLLARGSAHPSSLPIALATVALSERCSPPTVAGAATDLRHLAENAHRIPIFASGVPAGRTSITRYSRTENFLVNSYDALKQLSCGCRRHKKARKTILTGFIPDCAYLRGALSRFGALGFSFFLKGLPSPFSFRRSLAGAPA